VHQYIVYLASRLENDDSLHNYRAGVTQTAKCLDTIVRMPNFPGSDAALVVRAIFKFNTGNNLKDSPVSTRLVLLKLLQELMSRYPSNIKKDINPLNDLVVGIVGMGERELDPNCLNVLWPMYKDLGNDQVWDVSPQALKIIFDSFFRYFPITVGKKAGAQVSPDNLRLLLLDCFLSNDQYADYTFPELMEKLDTSTGESLSANVKVETVLDCKTF
jgi:DNA repair/transcription protein MET18/MMS19